MSAVVNSIEKMYPHRAMKMNKSCAIEDKGSCLNSQTVVFLPLNVDKRKFAQR